MPCRRVVQSVSLMVSLLAGVTVASAENPVIRDAFTADPAAIEHGGRVYLYTGHDQAKPDRDRFFVMREWRCYSSDDMKTFRFESTPLSIADFKWSGSDAWASQVVERDGKFFWYACTRPKGAGFGIGVAVSDSPTGPFKDAIGKPLIRNTMTSGAINKASGKEIDWDDLDPSVFIDKDGQAYLFWGNTKCRYARLKPNMIELDGEIHDIDLPEFTEAPWVHERDGTYYLSYAYGFAEKIAYATAPAVTGPWTFRGVINDVIPDSPTNHQAIIEFKGKWYFIYHNAALPGGGEHRRSVCVEELFYNDDGTIRPITQNVSGEGNSPTTQPSR
jgi:arabinoxylan arabinofuranohydrolase